MAAVQWRSGKDHMEALFELSSPSPLGGERSTSLPLPSSPHKLQDMSHKEGIAACNFTWLVDSAHFLRLSSIVLLIVRWWKGRTDELIVWWVCEAWPVAMVSKYVLLLLVHYCGCGLFQCLELFWMLWGIFHVWCLLVVWSHDSHMSCITTKHYHFISIVHSSL